MSESLFISIFCNDEIFCITLLKADLKFNQKVISHNDGQCYKLSTKDTDVNIHKIVGIYRLHELLDLNAFKTYKNRHNMHTNIIIYH